MIQDIRGKALDSNTWIKNNGNVKLHTRIYIYIYIYTLVPFVIILFTVRTYISHLENGWDLNINNQTILFYLLLFLWNLTRCPYTLQVLTSSVSSPYKRAVNIPQAILPNTGSFAASLLLVTTKDLSAEPGDW